MRTRSSWIWCWIIGAALAAGAGAQQYTTVIDNLPTCTGNRNGRVISVSDAISDSDCTVGGATGTNRFVHQCICDTLNALGPYWKAVGGGASSSNSFETVNLPAGTDPVADSATDTINVTCAAPLVCTGTAGTDTWAFSFDATLGTLLGNLGAVDNMVLRSDGTGGLTAQGSAISVSDVSGSTVTVSTSAGNALAISATAPAAANGASQAGKAASLTASAAVASLDTAGAAAGGSVTITGGAAARNTSGNANGGNIVLVGGAGIGTGTTGQVIIPAGTQAAPGLAISGDTDVGIYSSSANTLNIGGAGNDLAQFNVNGLIPRYGIVGAGDRAINGFKAVVTASTAVCAAPKSLANYDLGATWTNEGATAEACFALPTAVAGYQVEFCVQDADGLRVTASAGDTIRRVASVSATAGYIVSSTIGSCVTLRAMNATEWYVVDSNDLSTDSWTFN